MKKTKISVDRKLKIYEAQVVSIIIYNCNSWAAPATSFKYLDVTHRRHLRTTLNIKWPTGFITNADLYKRCNTTPLSGRVIAFRWRMLRHTLRSMEDSPAYLSILFAINSETVTSFKAAGQLRPLRHHIYRGAVVGVRGAAVGARGAVVGA